MKTNLEALKAVYVKNGGSLTDTYEDIAGGAPVSAYKTLKDAIAALSKLTLGGGSDLPDVTAADDAKYLVVDNGTWGASSGRIADYMVSEDLQAFINGIILPMASDLMTDYKWHQGSGNIGEDTRPDDYEELIAEIRKYTSATTGSVNGNPIRMFFLDTGNMMGYEFYTLLAQLGLVHVLIMFDDYQYSVDVIVYARREEVAS